MKKYVFRVELSDVSAKKEALIPTLGFCVAHGEIIQDI